MENLIISNTNANNNVTVGLTDTFATITVGKTDRVNVAPASKAIYGYEGVFARIDNLVAERQSWEQNAMRTCNEQLYALLTKCYNLYFEMCADTPASKGLRSGLAEYIEKMGYRFVDSAHNLTKIVKCVFGVDRRRVSAYSLVLREALAQKVKATDLAAFIVAGNGVEEIRRSKSKTAKTAKQKAELGKQAVCSKNLAVASGDKLAEKLDLANVGKDLVAIVTQQADGSLIIRKLINSQTVLNAALASAYSASKAENKQESKNNDAANDSKMQDFLIQQAANV